jgi:transposase InsO family protein
VLLDRTKKAVPIRHLVAPVKIRGRHEWHHLQALIDSGATYNFVSQLRAKEMDLEGVPTKMGHICTIDGNALQTYLTHETAMELTDDAGRTHQLEQQFVAADMQGYDVILGMPWLKAQNPRIDFSAGTWQASEPAAPSSSHAIGLATAEEFSQLMHQGDGQLYVVTATHGTSTAPWCPQLMATLDPVIPPEYQEYAEAFSKEAAEQLPSHGPQDHAIDLDGGDPPFGPLYNLSATELGVLREYIEDNLQRGFIRPSTSPAGAPILFVKKKDGSLRLCVDYRALNRLTVKNRHPLPLISEALDRLVGAKIYTKLDIRSAYNLIRIREGDEWKTAFRTRYGHFEYLVMPFGLANAPATFQAFINKVLREFLDVFCIAYLDDILIYSNTKEEHVQHVRLVLDRLLRNGLYAKLEKCEFHVIRIGFVGFVATPHGTEMEESRVAAVRDWPEPRTHREVQVFLGFANFYRRFIHKFSNKAQPLTDLLKGGKAGKFAGGFVLTDAASTAFRELKQAFTSAPMLRHYDPEKPIQVETDASGFAVAGVLRQPGDDPVQAHWHPVAFYSRKMTAAERNYGAGDAEMLAIVMAFKNWRHYLEGAAQRITVISDHDNLRSFMSTKELTRRHARWWERLSAFDFTITYRAGRLNPADPPSRRPDYESEEGGTPRIGNWARLGLTSPNSRAKATMMGAMVQLTPPRSLLDPDSASRRHNRILVATLAKGESPYTDPSVEFRQAVAAMQRDDSLARVLLPKGEGQAPGRGNPEEKVARQRAANLKVGGYSLGADGLVQCKGKLYVPERGGCRSEVLKRHHDDPWAGHFGYVRTLELIRRKYCWPHMARDVRDYVATCTTCQRIKPARHKPYGELQSLPLPRGPWADITMDFITDLPPSKKRGKAYDSILVVVDRYTKTARYIPVKKTITAAELADVFMAKIHRHYGQPDSIVTDRGSVFTAKFWQSFTHFLKIRRRLSTAFHPQTDGQTERQNQTLEQYLRAYVNYQQDDWIRLLPEAEFAYNNSRNATTGMTPFMALMGYNPSRDLASHDPQLDVPAVNERVQELRRVRGELETTWAQAVKSQASHHNRHTNPRTYNVGDMVYLSAKNIRTRRPNKKLDHKYHGPYKILALVGKQAYRLQLPDPMRVHPVFHVSLLESARRRNEPDTIPPPPVIVDGVEEFEVDEILDSRIEHGQLRYLVRWAGCDESDNSWEDADNVAGAPDLVREFHEAYPSRPAPGLNGPTQDTRTRKRRRGRDSARRRRGSHLP